MILLAVIIIVYTIRSITNMLLDLKKAAQRIAEGASNIQLQKASNDVIGSLSDSILRIDMTNRTLAEAAEAIGKGKFDITVKPRSNEDVLGNAIIQMKNDLHRFTSEMKELETRKDTFITMASHELKTPITSVKGYVQLILSSLEKGQEKELSPLLVRSSLISVDKQITRLTRLISELLDLSKIETGTLELKKERFSLNELAIETVEDILYINPTYQINVFHEGEVIVNADKDRIGQVLINFLTNAIKYSPGKSRIDVSVYKTPDNRAGLSVKDDGIGIEKNEQDKIFERFYRASGKEEQTYPGFGIGLFIAKEFIQKHAGEIMVESEKGKGSVFTF